jgi:hypothetical protein
MLLIELAGTANSLVNMKDAKHTYFVFVVTGRMKSNQKTYAKFGVPCAPVTKGTHLRPRCWVKHLVDIVHGSGHQGGMLFSCRLAKVKLMEFENNFFMVLEKVQGTTDLFKEDFDIPNECGIARTLLRSVTAHAQHMGVLIDLIKAINCWCQEANTATTGNPRLDMADAYLALMGILPTVLRYLLSKYCDSLD